MSISSLQVFSTEPFLNGTFTAEGSSSGPYTEPHSEDNLIALGDNNVSGSDCTYKEDFKRFLLPAIYSVVFLIGLPLEWSGYPEDLEVTTQPDPEQRLHAQPGHG